MKRLILFIFFFIFSNVAAGNEVIKVTNGKVLFSISNMKKFGPGTVVKIIDGDEEIARAKVYKVGKTQAVATLFSSETPVFKGYKVKIIVYKPPSNKGLKADGGRTRTKKKGPAVVPRKLAVLFGGGGELVGAMKGGESIDPTGFGPYMGLKGEVNYRISQHIGVGLGLDFYVGPDSVDMPAITNISSTPFKASGTFSDISLSAQYYLDRFEFYNYYISGSFMPIVGHKIIKEFTTSRYENAYTGTGLGLGIGKEWIFGKWLLQVNIMYKSYSLTSSEDNTADPARSIAIGQSVINGNLLLGYHF